MIVPYIFVYVSKNVGQIFTLKVWESTYMWVIFLPDDCNGKLLSHEVQMRPALGDYDSIASAATSFIM